MVSSRHPLSLLLLLLLLSDVGEEGGGTVMWVCASLGCKARVGCVSYILSSCSVWVSGFSLMSIAGERLAMGSVEQEKKKIIN